MTDEARRVADHSGFVAIICNRWIDEVKGQTCAREEGHHGPCRAILQQQDQP